jgi:ribosomal protein L37AE/L43A
MHTTPKLQAHLLAIANKHNLDVHQVGAYLRLDLDGVEHYLVIENLGACRLSVARYVLGSKGVADPELILYLDCLAEGFADKTSTSWIPIERVQRLGGWAIFAQTDVNGNLVNQFDPQGQHDLAEFAETVFLFTLISQGWLANGCRSRLPKPYLTEDEQWARGIAYPYNVATVAEVNELIRKVALRLAEDQDVDLSTPDAELTLTLPRRPIQLQVRKLDDERIAITRYVVDNMGDLAADPELVFRIEARGEWQPEELLYSPAVWDEYVQTMPAGSQLIDSAEGEVDLVRFTEYWAQRLVEEGWIEYGQTLSPELGVMSPAGKTWGEQGLMLGQRRIVTNVMAAGRHSHLPGCQSSHHAYCSGELWMCSGCGMTFCEAERANEHPDLCIDCGLEAAGWGSSGETETPVGLVGNCFIVPCDCPERDGSCGTWLALAVDGILTIEDKDGMWMSISLPGWLDTAMRQALQAHNQPSDDGVPF